MSDVDRRDAGAPADDSFDAVARDLSMLREEAGPVSYAELVRRITARRLARGIAPAAATPARSTVYSAFRPGRARLDPELLHDIVMALGATSEQADDWLRRTRRIRRAAPRPAADAGASSTSATAESASDMPTASMPDRTPSWRTALLVLVGCVAVNLLGLATASFFSLTVYLDMVGTAIAAIALGPWHAVVVAVASNGLGFVVGDLSTVHFIPVNVAGALVWGFGVRWLRAGTSLSRYGALQVVAAVACSLVATPIVLANFHGGDGHASEQAMLRLATTDLPFLASVFAPNVVTSIVDKLLSGFLALLAVMALHRVAHVPADHLPIVERLAPSPASAASR